MIISKTFIHDYLYNIIRINTSKYYDLVHSGIYDIWYLSKLGPSGHSAEDSITIFYEKLPEITIYKGYSTVEKDLLATFSLCEFAFEKAFLKSIQDWEMSRNKSISA